MSRHEREQSISNEPHLAKAHFEPDPSEEKVSRILREDSRTEQERVEQSIHEEVALGRSPDGGFRAGYFQFRRSQLGLVPALGVLLGTCLAASVFTFATGIIFSITMANATGVGFLAAITVAPPVEEFAKILLPLWIIDLRPWLFRWRWEIPVVCFVGALGFAVLENLVYLHVYIKDPSPGIILWRWTVCTMMHVSGAIVSSIGVARYWASRFAPSSSESTGSPMKTVGPFLAVAIAIHAAYNGFAVILGVFVGE